VSLHLFTSGTLTAGGVEAPVPFALIRHPEATVLVDGGNPLAAARDARAHWGELADVFELDMTEDQHCVPQLRRFGVEPEDVTHVVQTHLHMDHTGALGHFPAAEFVVQARELDAARSVDAPRQAGYIRADFEQPDLRWRTFAGDLDLFGDGTIRLLETPGHSAGHVSLLLELEETGPVLLTADAADNRAQWEGRARPRALFSREMAEQSLERLRDVARDTCALLVFGHDAENWAGLRHAPDGYA
jgi:glyoxylase-like metal-dependent hydrolase (beta-lactamase superfamily II)